MKKIALICSLFSMSLVMHGMDQKEEARLVVLEAVKRMNDSEYGRQESAIDFFLLENYDRLLWPSERGGMYSNEIRRKRLRADIAAGKYEINSVGYLVESSHKNNCLWYANDKK